MFVQVTGTGRSGTTLVTEILVRHPDTAFISGVDDKLPLLNLSGRLNGALYRWSPPRASSMRALSESTTLFERGRMRVAPSEAYKLIARQVMPGFATPCRDLVAGDMTPYLSKRFQDFFESRRSAQKSNLLVQHLTGWPRSGFLREAFPDMRVVNVVRDGRAVANSWLQMGWWDGWSGPDKWIFGELPVDLREEWEEGGRQFPVLAALGWRMLMRSFRDTRDQFDDEHWLDVRYEDFVSDARGETHRILTFLGLEWTEEFEQGFLAHTIESHRSKGYRDELTAAQVDAVGRALADELPRWGYEV